MGGVHGLGACPAEAAALVRPLALTRHLERPQSVQELRRMAAEKAATVEQVKRDQCVGSGASLRLRRAPTPHPLAAAPLPERRSAAYTRKK